MIVATDLSRLAPADKAAIIYAQARSDVATRLWRAALGSYDDSDTGGAMTGAAECPDFNLDTLLSLLVPRNAPSAPASAAPSATPVATGVPPSRNTAFMTGAAADSGSLPAGLLDSGAPDTSPRNTGSSDLLAGLGPNVRYSGALAAAAARTGIPAAAIAAIVDAEAGKDCNGSWKTGSRNPRSSAAGLGQFLSGTWQGEAERRGTWLHDTAVSKGWLGSDGRLLPAARAALLALRYDGTASINATADYARSSVAHLKQAGIAIGEDIASVARAAYLGHHLGAGDSVRFLKGGLDSGRARLLLDAQVGSANASQRVARTGDAASAHRSWLLDFVNRHVTPSRFGA
ncbi:peptidoglycan-binding protein [Sphingomonas sp. RT2P30]|uniref:peptidoglycan-binding protein n=1 Tax=Parasphingomonas halimpatiens TaxID=3096162 RepID=UPI002FC9F0C9